MIGQRLVKLIPLEQLPLFRAGLLVVNFPEQGPAPAWTEWSEERRRFEISILGNVADKIDDEALAALLEHEMNHIACGHFRIKCTGPDRLIAGDVEANGWMQRRGTFDVLEKKLTAALCKPGEDLMLVHPEEILKQLELDPAKVYRAEVIHDLIHAECPTITIGVCGGISQTDDGRAAAIGNATAATSPAGLEWAAGSRWGTGPGDGGLKYMTRPTPPWAEKMMEFARAIVEVALSSGRKHSRPIPALRQLGIHVPGRKPRWGLKPKTACIMVDTSGSMWCGDVLSYTAAAVSYLRAHNVGVRFIACDTRIVMDEELADGLPGELPGGGGTDIVPMFERAKTHGVEAAICITDCEVPRWPTRPAFDVLWIVPPHERPPFGEIAHYEG